MKIQNDEIIFEPADILALSPRMQKALTLVVTPPQTPNAETALSRVVNQFTGQVFRQATLNQVGLAPQAVLDQVHALLDPVPVKPVFKTISPIELATP